MTTSEQKVECLKCHSKNVFLDISVYIRGHTTTKQISEASLGLVHAVCCDCLYVLSTTILQKHFKEQLEQHMEHFISLYSKGVIDG